MAERRMFAKTIIDSDAFLDMPLSTQAMYFHLSMRADDDGFVNNPKKILRMVGGGQDDLKLLIAKQFIIPFDTGIVVIKHWKIHNYIQRDRYKETVYKDEKSMLTTKPNKEYSVMDTECIHDVSKLDTQDRIGKVSQGKDSKKVKHKYGEYKNVLLTDEEYQKLEDEYPDLPERIERLSEYVESTGKSYKSHYATIRAWARKDKKQVKKPNSFHNFDERSYDYGSLERKLLGNG